MKEDRLSQTVEFCKLIDREHCIQSEIYKGNLIDDIG